MIISGLNKLTLLDYPDYIACILFTGGCNLRCPFCHNFELVHRAETSYDTAFIMDFLKSRKNHLEAVVISGGEPCIHKDLPEFLYNIKSLGYLIKLDTNGCYPDMIKELINQSLIDYIAMDIKAPVYPDNRQDNSTLIKNIGIQNPEPWKIYKSITTILQSDIESEFRTTVAKELLSSEDLCNIASIISNAKRYFIQSFKRSSSVPAKNLTAYSSRELEDILKKVKAVLPSTQLR